jgi:hypothetical protein
LLAKKQRSNFKSWLSGWRDGRFFKLSRFAKIGNFDMNSSFLPLHSLFHPIYTILQIILPTQVPFTRGLEFIRHEFKKMLNDYGVKKKPNPTQNPQANTLVKQIHQTIGKAP